MRLFNNYRAFLGKELMENLRTKKFLVMICVFLSFAMTSPLLTRFMGEFLAFMLPGEDEMAMAMANAMGTPTWVDSYIQIYGNLGQIGAITVLLLFMGIILREKRSGTADLVFTKGLQPSAFVLAKFTMAGILILITVIASVLIGYIYTLVLFEYGGNLGHVFLGGLVFGVFMLMMLAIIMLCSAIARSTAISAVLGFFAFFFFIVLSAIPVIGVFTPGTLMAGSPIEITLGHTPDRFIIAFISTILITVLSLLAATKVTATRQM
ncbi:MAG: ABC transporter permease [Defluviitaleaceae bacterium]|nr:ABC transporter permease [Defluviitaleaceae bacterium]